MTNNGTTKYRVDVLDKRVNSMDRKIDELLTNHIPHIREEMITLKTRINVLTIVNVGAIILALLFGKFF